MTKLLIDDDNMELLNYLPDGLNELYININYPLNELKLPEGLEILHINCMGIIFDIELVESLRVLYINGDLYKNKIKLNEGLRELNIKCYEINLSLVDSLEILILNVVKIDYRELYNLPLSLKKFTLSDFSMIMYSRDDIEKLLPVGCIFDICDYMNS